jgi:hypothetical protein
MGNCYLKGKYLIGFPKALEPEEPDLNPYEDALVVLPFDGSIENVGVGADTYVPVASGTISYDTGIKGNAFLANNQGEIQFLSLAPLLTEDFTISYCFKLKTSSGRWRTMAHLDYITNVVCLGAISKDNRFVIGTQYELKYTIGSKRYNDGLWHFVVVKKEGDTLSAIIDNVEILSKSDTDYSTYPFSRLTIGRTSSPPNALIEQFCFWDRVLDDSEIDWLYNDMIKTRNCQVFESISGSGSDFGNVTDNSDTSYGVFNAGDYLVSGYDFSDIPSGATIQNFTITSLVGTGASINVSIPTIRKYSNGSYVEFATGQATNGFAPKGDLAERTFTFNNGDFGSWSASDLNQPYEPYNYSGFAFIVRGTGSTQFTPRYFKVTVQYTLDGESLLSAESEMLMEGSESPAE